MWSVLEEPGCSGLPLLLAPAWKIPRNRSGPSPCWLPEKSLTRPRWNRLGRYPTSHSLHRVETVPSPPAAGRLKFAVLIERKAAGPCQNRDLTITQNPGVTFQRWFGLNFLGRPGGSSSMGAKRFLPPSLHCAPKIAFGIVGAIIGPEL